MATVYHHGFEKIVNFNCSYPLSDQYASPYQI